MASILPVVRDFGIDPDRLTDTIETSNRPPVTAPPTPLGIDIAIDPTGEQLTLDRSNDLTLCGEVDALSQWARNAIITRRGVEQSLPPDFGSTLGDLIGLSVADINDVEEPVATSVESTILYHDRISRIDDLSVDFIDSDRIGFDATIVLDDDAILSIAGGAAVG